MNWRRNRLGRTRPCLLWIFIALVVGAAGCGLPTDESAVPLDVQTLPVELQPDATVITTTEPVPVSRDITLYYLNEKKLVSRIRSVPREATIEDELRLLFDYVPDETIPGDEGLRSDVALLSLVGVDVVDGTARINIEQTDEDTAYTLDQAAQLVFSATCRSDVQRVQFLINGQGAKVNTDGDQTEEGGLVTRENYRSYIPADAGLTDDSSTTGAKSNTIAHAICPE